MGTLQNESSQSATATDPQHLIGGNNDLSSIKKTNNSFSSNCSSPDTPLDSPFSENDDKNEKSTPKSVSNDKGLDSTPQPAVAANSSSSVSTESPSTQVMERPGDELHRIPSSVFAKDKSRKELEWSMISNESLFSIRIENMSFSGDQLLFNPEELEEHVEAHEAPSTDFSPTTSSSRKITEVKRGSDPAETSMREFLRDSKAQNHEKSCAEGRTSRCSDESGNSRRSFAFPILTDDLEKETSAKTTLEKKRPQTLPFPKQVEESSQTPQTEQQVAAPRRWFSCFTSCSLCS